MPARLYSSTDPLRDYGSPSGEYLDATLGAAQATTQCHKEQSIEVYESTSGVRSVETDDSPSAAMTQRVCELERKKKGLLCIRPSLHQEQAGAMPSYIGGTCELVVTGNSPLPLLIIACHLLFHNDGMSFTDIHSLLRRLALHLPAIQREVTIRCQWSVLH